MTAEALLSNDQIEADDAPRQMFLTCRQVANLLGVTDGRVRQLIATEALPSVKIGRSRYVAREQVEMYQWRARRPVGRPKGTLRYRLDALGRRRRVKYPRKDDYKAKRERERTRRRMYTRDMMRAELAEQAS